MLTARTGSIGTLSFRGVTEATGNKSKPFTMKSAVDDKKKCSSGRNVLTIIAAWISNIIFQYELITCLPLFEPWERYLINSFVLIVFGFISYSSCVYLPQFVISLVMCVKQFLESSYEYAAAAGEL